MKPVVLSPNNSNWPAQFECVREALLSLFVTENVRIEHVGSTAVIGLSAKPVLDVLMGVGALTEVESKIASLAALGFEYVSKYETQLPMRRYFVKTESDSTLRVHLHAVVRGSEFWNEQLAFRDALRADAQLRDAYQALKLQLATQFANDKSAYTEAKGPFIREALLATRCLSCFEQKR